MYDPIIGRWLEQDPIGLNAGDMNLYRVEGNNPVNLVDPSGLEPPPKDANYEQYKDEYKKIGDLKFTPKGSDKEEPFFPRLTKHDGTQYQVVGPSTKDYNCFAYAAGLQKTVFPKGLFLVVPGEEGLSDEAKALLKGDFAPLDKFYGTYKYEKGATWPKTLTNDTVEDLVKREDGVQKIIVFGERDIRERKVHSILHAAVQQPTEASIGKGTVMPPPECQPLR